MGDSMAEGGTSQGDIAHAERRRSARVLTLVAAIALMSVGDLYMTMVHLRGAGMVEMNPFARLVIQYQAPWVLIAWKLGTSGLAAGILAACRKKRVAELAAIACCVVMTALTVQWIRYSDQASRSTALLQSLADGESPAFVRMHDAP